MDTILFETNIQPAALLYSVCAGIALGLLYDVLRIVRRILRSRGILTAALDLAYWAVVLPVAFVVLWVSDQGALRLYILLGVCAGGGLYTLGPGTLLMRSYAAIEKAAKRLFARLARTRLFTFLTK